MRRLCKQFCVSARRFTVRGTTRWRSVRRLTAIEVGIAAARSHAIADDAIEYSTQDLTAEDYAARLQRWRYADSKDPGLQQNGCAEQHQFPDYESGDAPLLRRLLAAHQYIIRRSIGALCLNSTRRSSSPDSQRDGSHTSDGTSSRCANCMEVTPSS